MNTSRCGISTPLTQFFLYAAVWSSLVSVGCTKQHVLSDMAPVAPARACFALGRENLLGFMDKTGRLVTKPTYVTCEMDGWREGHLWVMVSYEPYSGTFIRGDGTPISPPKFGVLQILSPGLNNPYFFKGIAQVVLEGKKSAYIDTTGTILREGEWGPDEEGLIVVSSEGKFGYASTTETVVIPPRFDYAEGFSKGMARVRVDGKYRVIRRDGTFLGGDGYEFVKIASPSERTFWVGVNGRIGLANEAGRLLSDALFDEIFDMNDTRDYSSFVRETDGLWGLLGKEGAFLVPPSFVKVEHFDGGYAKVTGKDGMGLIDEAGVFHAPCRFEDVKPFAPGKAFAKKDGKWGLMGIEGEFLLEPQYDGVHVRCDRPALVYVLQKSNSWNRGSHMARKWGVVRSDGKVAATPTFSNICHLESPHHDLVVLWIEEKCGLGNVWKLTTVLPISYDRIDVWGRGLYAVWSGKYAGLVTATGEWRLPLAARVDSLPSSLHNDHGPIHAKSGIGLISNNGKIALPCRYQDVGNLSEGLVPAKQVGRWGYVNLDGKWVVPPQYEEAGAFRDGYAAVRLGGQVGQINKKGAVKVPFQYADAGYVYNGRFPAARELDGKLLWGIVDIQGQVVLPLDYDCVEWVDLMPDTTRYHGKICWQEF